MARYDWTKRQGQRPCPVNSPFRAGHSECSKVLLCSRVQAGKLNIQNGSAQHSKRLCPTSQTGKLNTPNEPAHTPSGASPQPLGSLLPKGCKLGGKNNITSSLFSLSEVLVGIEAIFVRFSRARIVSKTDTKPYLTMCIS